MRLLRYATLALLCAAIVAAPAVAGWESYKELFLASKFPQLTAMCVANKDAIQADPSVDVILKYCGMAELALYKKDGQTERLSTAIDYLEQSVAIRYSEEAAYHLGLARLKALDRLTGAKDQLAREKEGLNDLWESLLKMHATENFSRDTLSNTMLVWSQNARDSLIERVLNNEKNPARTHLLAAMIRGLADRFTMINPDKGETEVRKGNLKIFKEWMRELLELSYFDNNIIVGMYKYRGDRQQEQYDQTPATDDHFTRALYNYNEALKRVKTNKARAVLSSDVAYLATLYTSSDKEKLAAYYKLGFDNANEGLQIMRKLNERAASVPGASYPYEVDGSELTAKLQKSFGANLTGLAYEHYLRKDYASIVGLRTYLFDAGFDWENKSVTFTLLAETADKLAAEHYHQPEIFKSYKALCLAASSHAFKLVMKKQQQRGRGAAYSPEFCRAYQYYVNYLNRFGETIEARDLSSQYEQGCQNVGAPQ
jgi:hypothetical protein